MVDGRIGDMMIGDGYDTALNDLVLSSCEREEACNGVVAFFLH